MTRADHTSKPNPQSQSTTDGRDSRLLAVKRAILNSPASFDMEDAV